MDYDLRQLFREMRLENTRLLVKGVARLHQGFQRTSEGRDGGWRLGKLQEFVTKAYRESIQDGGYLAQNPYVELFRFRRPEPDEGWMEKEDSARLAGMILLYHQLQVLEDAPMEQLAEAYEDLCNSVRNILEADMCYLVSRRLTDTRMLSASSVTEEDLDRQLGSTGAGELLDRLGEPSEFSKLAEGVFAKKTADAAVKDEDETVKNADALILPIALYDKKGRPREEQVHLICQRRGKGLWSDAPEETLLRARDTLFLRGQLAQALMRDLAGLLTVAREYRDIGRKTGPEEPLRILHISDLHVTGHNYKKMKADIKKLELDNDIAFDFLAITGDVAQGRYAAGDLEKHYDCAAKVIRALAFRMWSEEQDGKRLLRQDWKRRTIVIPGNHDYASMNELETQHGENRRTSLGGRPAAQEGSAMAKFTYYINFIRKLLDIEVGELIDNNLNELRCYDKIGVDFVCFNTSSMANPDRNNKVHLDQDFANHAARRLSEHREKRVTVFLCHHGPKYEIDYISDEYLEPYICHSLTKAFVDAVTIEDGKKRKAALGDLKARMEVLEPTPAGKGISNDFVQAWLVHNNMKELPVDVKEKVVERRKKTRLYRQLAFLTELMKKDEAEWDINDRYQKITTEVKRAKILSDKDETAYKAVFNGLAGRIKPTVCLSGHTHVWDREEEKRYYVAKRFVWERMKRKPGADRRLRQISSLNYGVCEIFPPDGEGKIPVKYREKEEEIPNKGAGKTFVRPSQQENRLCRRNASWRKIRKKPGGTR